MKKLLYCAAALAMAFFAGSCQQENLEPVAGNGTVTFTVEAPANVQTKAIADGLNVNELVYEVWLTNELGVLTKDAQKLYQATTTMAVENGVNKASITLDLVNDQKFTVLFWAQVNEADAYNTTELTEVTYAKNEYKANDESLAAFYAVAYVNDCRHVTKNGTPTGSEVTLRRPFAQLNLGTLNTSTAYDVELVSSKVKVTNANTEFNVATSVASEPKVIEFLMNAVPADPSTLEVNAVAYEYAGMNYLFEGDNATVEYDIVTKLNDGMEGTVNNTVSSVPLKENYRTNIVGNLLTSKVGYEIVVDAKWAGSDLAPDPIHLAAANGGEVTLTEDIVLEEPLDVTAKMTINLNGKTISGNFHKSEGAIINNSGTLTITGGTISSLGNNGGSAVQNSGTMTVEDVTLNGAPNADGSWPSYTVNNTGKLTITNSKITSYHGAVASYGEGAIVTLNDSEIDMAGIPGFTSHGIYTYNSGKVIVNGGTYANEATDQASTGASVINGAVEVNAGDFSGRIDSYYGTPVLKGGSYTVKPNKNFIAAGYKCIDKNGKYYVVSDKVEAVVSGNEDLKAALEAAKDSENTVVVNVVAGTYGTLPAMTGNVVLNCAEGTVFTGTSGLNINGATVIGATFENKGGVAASGTIHGTFKNCTFDGSEALRWCYSTAGKDVVFEDCEIKTDFRGFHFDGMEGNVIFRRCQINGFNAYGGEGTATFENCVFGNDESSYNGLNIYSNTVLKDCKFVYNSGKTNFIDMEGTGKTLSITNCTATLDGTETPVIDFVGGSQLANNTVILDGKTYASSQTSLSNALNNGATEVLLKDGNYTMPEPDLRGKGLTITGSKDVVIDATAVDARDQFVTGATLKFEGVTLNFGKVNYMGFANTASLTYKDCNINGLQFLFGENVVFENCDLNSNGAEHTVWTYGAKNVTFTDCDFTYGDRAVNCYSDNDGGKQTVNFTDCTFATSNTASEGAVEINSCFFSVGIEVNMDGCTAPAYGQMAYVSPWDSTNGSKTTINIK